MILSLSILLHFLLGSFASFVGALPLGTVNLSLVQVSSRRGFREGVKLGLAASLVEIGQFLAALFFGILLVEPLTDTLAGQLALVLIFLLIGGFFFFRQQVNAETRTGGLNSFQQGFVLALINPQALPFWVFIIAWFQSEGWSHLDPTHTLSLIIPFLAGVWLGKMLALMLFGWLSVSLVQKVPSIGRSMNKIIGGVLIGIGVIQGLRLWLW